jgi:type I restriction enzyme M protein
MSKRQLHEQCAMSQENRQPSGQPPAGAPAGDKVLSADQVRQWLLEELVDRYGYEADFLRRRGHLDELEARGGQPLASVDVLTESGSAFLSLVAAPTGGADAAEACLRERLLGSDHTAIGVCSDGTERGTRVLRRRFGSRSCEYVSELHAWSGRADRSRWYVNGASPREGQPTLEPLDGRLEHIFFEVYSHFRDIDGLHAAESLEELCKLLFVKTYDERSTAPGQAYRLQGARYGCAEELAVAAREAYDEATKDLDASPFDQPFLLSNEALDRAVRALAGHSFLTTAADVKGRAFQKVLASSSRAGMGQYFTPAAIIELMVEVVAPAAAERVLDPFAGSAHFLRCARRFASPDGGGEPTLFGLEKSEQMARVAWTDQLLHEETSTQLRCTDSLLDFSNYRELSAESFDVVLTNPPFGSVLGQNAFERLGDFDLARGRSSVPLEILGLERSVQFLRPGGRFAIVLPDGVLANKSTRYVRDWLREHIKVRAIIGLPVEAFSPLGAHVKTSILFGRKWRAGEARTDDHAVFLGRAEHVGQDSAAAGGDDELGALTRAATSFLEQEGW